MSFTSAFILLLSLASQSLALPVEQRAVTTFDDGQWHPATVVAVASSTASVKVPTTAPVIASVKPTVSTKTSATSSTATATAVSGGGAPATGPVTYKKFKGDGSVAQGWPSISQWISFENMYVKVEHQVITTRY